MSTQSIEEIVRHLARKHFHLEKGIERFIWFKNGEKQEIHLIEINQNTIPEGAVIPFYLRPTSERPLPILIGDITPDEWEKVKNGLMPLPEGWSLDHIEIIERKDVLQTADSGQHPETI
jgi:hypothetical protein